MSVILTPTQPSTTPSGTPSGRLGWESFPSEITRSTVIMSVYGLPGTGRTSFACTAPGPIAYLHDNEKVEPVAKFAKTKDIRAINFMENARLVGPTRDDLQSQAKPFWDSLKMHWFDAFKWARTIILDTETAAYDLQRFAYFGDYRPADGRQDQNWGPPNKEWELMFRQAPKNQERCNVILISKGGDKYKKEGFGTTGEIERKGHKQIGFWCDVAVLTEKVDSESIVGGKLVKQRKFRSVVTKGWYRGEVEGVSIEGEANAFSPIMETITGRQVWR